MNKHIRTRLLSVLMALTLMLGLVPTAALAEGEDAAPETVVTEEAAPETPEEPGAEPAGDAEATAEVQADGETEVPVEPEAPAAQEYTKSYSSSDFSGKYISSIKYTVTTTDENGAKLADGSGEISMVEGAGEWVKQTWTRTDRCNEWTKIIGMLQDAGVNVDSRSTSVFDLSLTDSDGNAITLDGDNTTVTVETSWGGTCNYKVYIYDGTKVYEETEGDHTNLDYSDMLPGYHVGSDEFTVPAGSKVIYVTEFTPAEPLAPGAYTVDADLTVLGKNNQVLDGIQVYLSNPELPPTKPMKQKGYLVVHEDGTMTLSLDGFNHIFSQQTITSGKDVTVDSLRYFNMRDWYVSNADSDAEKEQYKQIPETCIDGITVTLNNYNGYYSFGNCTQYPVILFKYTDMCLDLIVDFSTAVKAYVRPGEGETSYNQTFTDETTGVSVQVETTEDWGQKLADASMSITYLDQDDPRYEDAKFQMDRLFVRDCYKVLAFKLTDKDGNEFTMEGNCQATVSGADVSGWTNPVIYQLNGDIARTQSISSTIENSKASFTVRTLNPIALIGKFSRTDDGITKEALPFVWVRSEAADNTYSLTEYMIGADGQSDSEYGQTTSAAYLDCKVASTMRTESSDQGDRYYAKLNDSFNNTFKGISKVEVQLPYDMAKPYYYIVLTDGTSNYVKQYTNTTVYNGSVYFDIINSFGQKDSVISYDDGTYDQDWGNILLNSLMRGYNGAVPSASAPTAYILNSGKLYAGQPFLYSTRSMTYSGKDQTEATHMCNDTMVLSGVRTAKDAGTYTVTAAPAEGRTWLDGTSEPVSYTWTIKQKNLFVKYAGETIHEGETPALTLTYSGLVDGETPENAKGFEPATITLPDPLTAGSYTLTPAGGKADNYNVYHYTAGTLLVVSADTKIIDKPTAVPGKLLANGEEQVGVPEGEGYTLSGDYKATEGGKTYTATATLKDGYVWSDGSNSASCDIKWSLYKGVEKPVFEKTVFVYTGERITLDADKKYTSSNGYTARGVASAIKIGDYTMTYTPNDSKKCLWTDGTDDPVVINWSIVEKIDSGDNGGGSSGGSTEKDKVTTVTANLYLPGEYNQVLPGITVYLNNSNNPIQGTGTPTVPKANNAKLTTKADGTMLLTLDITNPVFTLQKIDDCKNATVKSTKTSSDVLYQGTTSGKYSERISQITVELNDKSGVYEFRDCTEFPTLIGKDWNYNLILKVQFEGGKDDSLDSNKDVDTGNIGGSSSSAVTTPETGKGFTDVADNAYYKAAVDWAVEKGITSGTTATTFAPSATCTRAQTVTFLWRAAGSPEPSKTENPFTDVKADAYYYKAVLWAVEKGITSGTTATTFAPDATVTRAQVVTFLNRMAGSPKAEGTNPFSDVAENAYYHDAVLWAAKNGITSGMTATTFAPNAGCTRGQIVTFLYRQLAK